MSWHCLLLTMPFLARLAHLAHCHSNHEPTGGQWVGPVELCRFCAASLSYPVASLMLAAVVKICRDRLLRFFFFLNVP